MIRSKITIEGNHLQKTRVTIEQYSYKSYGFHHNTIKTGLAVRLRDQAESSMPFIIAGEQRDGDG